MASLSHAQPLLAKTPFFPTKPQNPSNANYKKYSLPISRRSSISCSADNAGEGSKIDRRNVLLGLGSLYGAAGLASDRSALAAGPILAPDLSKCLKDPSALPEGIKADCCPPYENPKIIDFRAPPIPRGGLRVRPAAHSVDKAYIAKYERALQKMRDLDTSDPDDPRGFKQQAKIHCAYCNGAYDQVGFGDLDLQIHFSWLFFPFHRWYLYFFERILGDLIDDPTFAIPFWNWDTPAGMKMPAMYLNPSSPLYDVNRSTLHQPPYLLDLNYDYKNKASNVALDDAKQIEENLVTMYKAMVSGAKIPSLFFGGEYLAGVKTEKAAGTIENTPHTQIHVLSGLETNPNGEDMGNFYSAGRDPIFYGHHGNVDRMWSVWKTLGGRRKDITDPNWLDAAFLFYDEKKRLVRVTVRDCLDTKPLGYVYEDVRILWDKSKPKRRGKGKGKGKGNGKRASSELFVGAARAGGGNRVALSDFPIILMDKAVSVVVARPKAGRSAAEKDEEEEVLVIEGIEFDSQVAVKFDVYLDDEDEGDTVIKPDATEYAGSFGNVPHKTKNNAAPEKVKLKLGISDLLEDIEAEDDDSVIVTLVPKTGDPISIDGIKIVLAS